MPEKTLNTIKNPEQYETLRKQGMSKEKVARIANSGREASVKGGKSLKYEEWNKEELLMKAKEVGIKQYYKLTKKQLIHALRNN